MTRAVAPPGAGRRFLIVTAPFGPFSRALGRALREAGAECERVVLNLGDAVDWGAASAVAYRGTQADFGGWIAQRCLSTGVTDLLVHGDSHPYAVAAMRQARQLGLRIHVFEQGYFRPDWITLEPDGVNARSNLPRCREHFDGVPLTGNPSALPTGRITAAAVRWIARYHLVGYLGAPLFPRFRNPYSVSPARQAIGHFGAYLQKALRSRQSLDDLRSVVDAPGPLFLVLLQRPGDSQLTQHSSFDSVTAFIEHVLASFDTHAPPDARLLFKAHPLDHGLERHDRVVTRVAKSLSLAGRVAFTDEGSLTPLLLRADGIVSINSTGGLSGVEFGLPTIAVGSAIYDMPGLTHQGGLASFWTAPQPPDPELFQRFRIEVSETRQINGAFSTPAGMALAVPEAVRRLLDGHPISRSSSAPAAPSAPQRAETAEPTRTVEPEPIS